MPAKKVPARFYVTTAGREPVREWLRGLSEEKRKRLGGSIADVEFGWPIGMPVCRSLGDGLWEIRSIMPDKTTARILFAFHKGEAVLLHGFIKKTQKTPAKDLDLASSRRKEIET